MSRRAVTSGVMVDPWQQLKSLTRARVALGHAGGSLPTEAHLTFQLAHARARDAVHAPMDQARLIDGVERLGVSCCVVASAANDRACYLKRPDLGRRLSVDSSKRLEALATSESPDVVIVMADGLSARAVEAHGLPLLERLLELTAAQQWSLAPVIIATRARVALGDDIGQRLKARMVLMLIGERPGLSSPDSLGAYLTYAPRRGLHDDARNCVSNIRPEGLGYGTAAFRLEKLMASAMERQLSGVALKDDSEPVPALEDKADVGNFLAERAEKPGKGN